MASFVALPLLGIWGSFGLVASVYLVAGLTRGRSEVQRHIWIPAVMASAVVVLGMWAPRTRHGLEPGQELVGHWDTAYGWVDVVRDQLSAHTSMQRDVYHVMGSTETLWQERWYADLPLFLHPKPARTLFIGLGTGITAGEALAHPDVEHVTVVELIPEVVRAARLFSQFNENVLDDPRTTLLANDGRHYLAATDDRFDVVVADLFVPWESQTGYLYTVEHYRAARNHLRPGGLYCQWLPTWQLREKELVMIADSFASVFAHVSVWLGSTGPSFVPVAFIGSDRAIPMEGPELIKRMKGPEGLRSARMEPSRPEDERLGLYCGEWKPASSPSALNTDAHPRVEFMAPHVQFNKGEQLAWRPLVLEALSHHLTNTNRLSGRGDDPRNHEPPR